MTKTILIYTSLLAPVLVAVSSCRGQEATRHADGRFELAAIEQTGVLRSRLILESSGLTPSHRYPGMFWTHNDNGPQSGVFLIDGTGELRATVRLHGAVIRDWEDIASFVDDRQRNMIVVADTGDNARRRPKSRLYFVEEPELALNSRTILTRTINEFQTVEFTFPDGPRDCEAMAADAVTKEIWMITKELPLSQQPAEIYRLKLPWEKADQPIRAERVGVYRDWAVTGMDIAAGKQIAIVRNYMFAKIYYRADDESWGDVLRGDADATFTLPPQRQGEAVCFDVAARSILMTSESPGQPIWKLSIRARNQHP